MDLRRSINVKFWTDEWIEKLDQKGKLLFLYLLTNPLTNLLGIYKISIKRISFETGLTDEAIKDCLKSFESISKCFYFDEYIILVNHIKNQNLNTNMVKNVMSDFDNLPNSLKDKLKLNHSECFESLSKGLQTLSTLEKEKEIEILKVEKEIEIVFPENFSDNRKNLFKNWFQYKKEIKDYYKSQKSIDALFKKYGNFSDDNLMLMIENAIANGYKGIFELKQINKKNNPLTSKVPMENEYDETQKRF